MNDETLVRGFLNNPVAAVGRYSVNGARPGEVSYGVDGTDDNDEQADNQGSDVHPKVAW